MKKNWTMRVAVLMVALTLITACFVSGTFAKYVTSGNSTDTARVAKFGVTVTGETGMFFETYEAHDSSFTLADNTVVSTDQVVAPGTSGELTKIGLDGTPEVAVRVNYAVTSLELANWVDGDGEYYCPLIIKVGTQEFNGASFTSADDFEAAVEAAIEATTVDYEAGTDLSDQDDDGIAISWSWPFTTGDANDVKDTYLGDQAALDNAATITLGVTCTVTQID